MKMKKMFKDNWGKFSLALLLMIICVISFKVGFSYISNDNYSPGLNPLLTIQRSLESPAWRSYRVLGFASESEQADVFRSGLYYILDLLLPTWSLSQVFALLCLFVGSWFTGLLGSSLIKDTKKKKYSELVFLLGGIFYISTLWTVWVYYQNMFPYITQFGFLPLVIWSIYRLIKDFNWKNALVLFFSSILFTSTFVIATLFVVDVVVIFIFALIFALTYSKGFRNVFKKVFLTILLFLFTQLFWILPFIHYTVNVSGDISDSYTNRTITTSVIDLESRDQDALNSAKLFTRSILEEDENGEYIFERADEYATYDFFNVIGLIPLALTVVLLIVALIKRKWIYVALSFLSILIWFVVKNVNPPLGNIFVWLQENIPLFKQVFRWVSSKTLNIYLLLISLCAPIGFVYLIDFLGGFLKKGLKYALFIVSTLIISGSTLFYAQYLFTGELFPQKAIIEIPNEYYQMRDFLEEKELTEKRILYFPMANNNYFRKYDWGFYGSNFISYIIPNPIMDLSSAIGSKYGEEAILDIQKAFKSNDLESFNQLLSKYEVDYLLVDTTLDENGFTYSWNWNEIDLFWKDRELDFSTEDLFLYSTSLEKTGFLTESNSNQDGTFSYIESGQNPTITVNPESYDNWDIEKGFLVSKNIYNGEDITLSNSISYENIEDSPTILKIEDFICLYPAIPTIDDINTKIYKKYEFNNSDIVVVNDEVLGVTGEYTSIEETFKSDFDIYVIENSDFTTQNLTSELALSTPYECISGEKEETTAVILQGGATGFELSGDEGNPCIYSQLDTSKDSDNILKVNINWETLNNSSLGYCIYSQNEQECLNAEKYFSAQDGIGDIDILLDTVISKTDYVGIILYVLNTSEDPNVTIRDVSVSYASVENKMNLLDQNLTDYKDDIFLEQGNEYEVKIPIILGDNSYTLSNLDTVWQPNVTEDTKFTTYNDLGIYQEVQDDFANSSINLFTTTPLSKYLLYWKGKNISNIPANLCIAYSGDNKCWVQEMMYDDQVSSGLNMFTMDKNRTGVLDLSLVSTSYNLTTKNTLNNLVIMNYPEQWQDISYIPTERNTKTQVEPTTVGSSLSTIYSYSEPFSNNILTIPQASESGWVAISIKDNIPQILKNKVLVNGWKQGWDISDIEYDNIYIIYYPNLLAYLGYILLIVEFLIILINLIIKKNGK